MRAFPWVYAAAMARAERSVVGRLGRTMLSDLRDTVLEVGVGTGLDLS